MRGKGEEIKKAAKTIGTKKKKKKKKKAAILLDIQRQEKTWTNFFKTKLFPEGNQKICLKRSIDFFLRSIDEMKI